MRASNICDAFSLIRIVFLFTNNWICLIISLISIRINSNYIDINFIFVILFILVWMCMYDTIFKLLNKLYKPNILCELFYLNYDWINHYRKLCFLHMFHRYHVHWNYFTFFHMIYNTYFKCTNFRMINLLEKKSFLCFFPSNFR